MAILRFAFTIDNEVTHVVDVPEDHPAPVIPRMITAYRSNPIFVEIDNEEIGYGWTYDGVDFHPPVE